MRSRRDGRSIGGQAPRDASLAPEHDARTQRGGAGGLDAATSGVRGSVPGVEGDVCSPPHHACQRMADMWVWHTKVNKF